MLRTVVLLLVANLWLLCQSVGFAGQESLQGAGLLKTDIMGIFAHPDDETGMAATLAFYALGRTSIVANVYCTRGEGGGNMVGTQWGAALATLREAELRDCLRILGVRYCYFLDQLDWAYTESLSATLRKWGKEQTLERLVRLVRALQPEIILTMNPAPTPGQHGHHQAAAVLATEAFTAAADPLRFPLQLSKEGLTVWQPRKLFYGGGNTGVVATIDLSSPLPNGKLPYQVAGEAMVNHRSQAFGNFGNSGRAPRPQRFTLVKSFVPLPEVQTDLLAGLPAAEVREVPFTSAVVLSPRTLEWVPRPAVANYQKWAREQGIEHVAARFRPDLPVIAGEPNELILRFSNSAAAAWEGKVRVAVPEGWGVAGIPATTRVGPHAENLLKIRISPPANARKDSDNRAIFESQGEVIDVSAVLHPVPRTRVARLRTAPSLDGSNRGWDNLPVIEISPNDSFQGKVAGQNDCSARFRLAHDSKFLFVDVQVSDDAIVSNIAPNDIKGHWRSDSIEICIDPAGGAEDTMGCFKMGIFPFDTTGAVRAARDADANQGPIEETAPGTRLVSRRTSDGYRIQAAIPFSEIRLPRGKKRLGFNLIVYDGDKPNAAIGENINKSRIAWAPRAGVMGRPEDWGRIDLE
jgi:LmbE family N-acetylglucosaminyl deacetylase